MSSLLARRHLRAGWPLLAALATLPSTILAQAPDDDGPNVPVAEYQQRRQKALESYQDGVLVMLGSPDEEFGEFVKFRQRNDLMYLTGAGQPDVKLLLVPGSFTADGKPKEMLFLPAKNPFTEQWMGRRIGPGDEAVSHYGIAEALPADKFRPTLMSVLKQGDGAENAPAPKVYINIARRRQAVPSAESLLVDEIKKEVPDLQVAGLGQSIAQLRKIKSAAEIALLQKAIDITGDGQRAAAEVIRPGAFEYQAQGALEGAFLAGGAERPGYFSIVGSGPNSCVLHYNDNRRRMKEGELVVVDVGAEFHYYTADITRTYPVSGKFTERQRQVYQLVLDAQRAAEESFELGKSNIGTLAAAAQKTMRESPLRDSQGNTLDRHFVHGLGHWLGMDVHDVGDYGGPLPVGSVFTIEPGIYLADEELGVRIEDDYLVTENGLVKLSAKIPSDPDQVEKLMATARP
jgi:Xaa-Pro aminopeptidase